MDKVVRKGAFGKFIIALYIILTLAFLVESALPGGVSSVHSLPLVKFFASLRITPTLKLDNGENATSAELFYDKDDGVGTLIRVIPGGATSVVSVISDNDDIISVTEHYTTGQGKLWLLRAMGAGKSKVNVTVKTKDVTKSKSFEFNVTEGNLTPKEISQTVEASSSNIIAGDSVTFSLNTLGEDNSSGSVVRWGSSNKRVLDITHWFYDGAAATFQAKMAGSTTVYATNYNDGSVVASTNITVHPGEGATFSITDDSGAPISDSFFGYDTADDLGEFKKINIIGASGVRYRLEGDDIIKIVGYTTATQTHYYVKTLRSGSATLMLESKDDATKLYYNITVSEKDLNPLPSEIKFSNINESITVGGYITVSVSGTDGHPVCWRSNDGNAKLYSLDILKGTAVFKMDKVGDATLLCFDPIENKSIREFKITVTEKPTVTTWAQFSNIVRKALGHFSWCAAMGIILLVAFKKRFSRLTLSVFALTQAAAISSCAELIQAMTPGRYCSFGDICINFFGYMAGFILTTVALIIINAVKRRKEPTSNTDADEPGDDTQSAE